MIKKGNNNDLRILHSEVLRAHALLLKKHANVVDADKRITTPSAKGSISKKDIANYTKARDEANLAHKKWADAQLKYFKFIEKQKVAPKKGK
jgi:hypothetical protein